MLEIKLLSRKLPEYKEVWRLYKTTFPTQERIPIFLLNILRLRKFARFAVFYQNGQFSGFSFLINYHKITFILYFAVSDQMRSKGCGTTMLKWIESEYPDHTLILNIEDVDTRFYNYDQRLRRYNFYLKNGFVDSGYYEGSKKVPYDILYKGDEFPKIEYIKAASKLSFGIVKLRIHPKKEIHEQD